MHLETFPKPRIGFDVGNVILETDTDGSRPAEIRHAGSHPLDLPQSYVDGALSVIRDTVGKLGAQNVHIISKCGVSMQQKTQRYFEETNFFDKTNFARENVWFVKKRAEKAPIAARLALTHFVDDRSQILRSMTTVSVRMLFQIPYCEVPIDKTLFEPELVVVKDWAEVDRVIKSTTLA